MRIRNVRITKHRYLANKRKTDGLVRSFSGESLNERIAKAFYERKTWKSGIKDHQKGETG